MVTLKRQICHLSTSTLEMSVGETSDFVVVRISPVLPDLEFFV